MKRKILSYSVFAIVFTSLVLYFIWEPDDTESPRQEAPHVIMLSKGAGSASYDRYAAWLRQADSSILYIDAYHLDADSLEKVIGMASGLLLTGGPDLHPSRYGMTADTSVCGTIDLFRDSLEFELIRQARERHLPVMGICRGLQVLNVAFGGSLYADIPSQLGIRDIHRCADPDTCLHEVSFLPGTRLSMILGDEQGNKALVNSNHHQCVRDLAPGLTVSARSTGGVTEAIEGSDPDDSGFLIAVQWHPEKAAPEDRIANMLSRRFIAETYLYQRSLENTAR